MSLHGTFRDRKPGFGTAKQDTVKQGKVRKTDLLQELTLLEREGVFPSSTSAVDASVLAGSFRRRMRTKDGTSRLSRSKVIQGTPGNPSGNSPSRKRSLKKRKRLRNQNNQRT